MSEMLRNIIARNNASECIAIPSVRSAHTEALSTSLQLTSNLNRQLVIAAKSDHVNKFGGDTPKDARKFVAFIDDLKSKHGIQLNIVELGVNHLGPKVWKSETTDMAMTKAHDLAPDYVPSGIKKILLDCSEGCADEPPLVDSDTAAEQAADLAVSCLDTESAPEERSIVISTEVPRPGDERLCDDGHIILTSPQSAVKIHMAHCTAFAEKDMADSWPKVSGLVFQPGIEFGPDEVFNISKGGNSGLRDVISEYPVIFLKAHSAVFQSLETFVKLVNMGFAFQKVGPALTFALRRTFYALNHILQKRTPSAFALPQFVEAATHENPKYCKSHYQENDITKWHFSYASLLRYYWHLSQVKEVVGDLILTFDKLKVAKHILEQSFSSDVLERWKGLAVSRGRAIVRSEVKGILLPYFLGDRDA